MTNFSICKNPVEVSLDAPKQLQGCSIRKTIQTKDQKQENSIRPKEIYNNREKMKRRKRKI